VGCDSIATLVLTVKATSTSSTPISICPSALPYTWNGKTYNVAGTYTATLTNSVGCDSIATLILTVKTATSSTNNLSICASALPYSWNGLTFTAAGSQTKTGLINSQGCDSSATLNLTVKTATSSTTNLSICASALPYTWNGLTFNAAGSQTKTGLINSQGCDSSATLVLTINNKPSVSPISGPSSVEVGETISLINTTPNGIWSLNPSNIFASITQSGIVTGLSLGNVTAKYTLSNICSDSTVVFAIKITDLKVFIPNLFTPNNDGKNDIFYVRGNPAKFNQVQMRIFDSWGNLIYEAIGKVDDKSIGWNGTSKGKSQPAGEYIYVMKIVANSGNTEVIKGIINLAR